MKPGLIIFGATIIIGLIFFISKLSGNSQPFIQVAKQIKLDQLEAVMEQLKNKSLEYNFFGITSNGIDCIYFVNNKGMINIEFEVMTNEQKPYIEKIKEFAISKKYRVTKSSYGNKPQYVDLKEAPVYKLEINAGTKTATDIGKQIMTEIFNCDMTTNFDVVP